MDVMEQRRRNLKLLAAQWGGPTGLAKKLRWSGPSYVSQLTGGQRPFTEKTARKIEAELELPVRWLDDEHRAPERPAKVDESLVRQVVLLVGAVLEEMKLSPGAAVFADVVELAYEDATRKGHIDEDFIRRVARLSKR